MECEVFQFTWAGPVRSKNEDCIDFARAAVDETGENTGYVAIIADGVGGQGDGDIAARIACRKAIDAFHAAKPNTSPSAVLRQIFNDANLGVYDASMDARGSAKRMATTLTVSIFQNNQVCIGHVGDCRVYHIHAGKIDRVTDDHSYTGMQMKMGLISATDAANSQLRCILTRSIGQHPTVKVDYHTITVQPGDYIVQCSDGLHACLSEQELRSIVTRWPEEAPRELMALAERRHVEDNVSAQVVLIKAVRRPTYYYRGTPVLYRKTSDVDSGQDVKVGQTLDGRFEIIDVISRSGMASIFKAKDLKDNRTVALKIPYMKFESDPAFFSRFQREEEIGRKLHHPSVLRIEDTSEMAKSRPYLVMEYLEGETLGSLMRTVKPLPETDALKIASRLADALAHLHENEVIHRDLKPENIMICNDGTLRIMDFGIAKIGQSRRLTFGGFQPAMGTPDYMAPEQVKGKRGDARTDIYSLGAILYEMVTGYPPFEGANPLVIMNARLSGDPTAPRERNPQLSKQAEEIILHAMARDPQDRYASAADMKRDLDHVEEVEVTGRAQRLVAPTMWKTGWRISWVWIIGCAIPILLFLFFFILTHVEIHLK